MHRAKLELGVGTVHLFTNTSTEIKAKVIAKVLITAVVIVNPFKCSGLRQLHLKVFNAERQSARMSEIKNVG